MAEQKQFDQEFVEYLVSSIVEQPDDVTTERIVDEMGTLISLHVNAEDMSTIIGKEGRTAKALRTVLRVLGAKHNERINLKIIEPEGGRAYTDPESNVSGSPAEAPFDFSTHASLKDLPTDEIA